MDHGPKLNPNIISFRHQVLFRNLKGDPLGARIFFSGSIERTSFAEMHEPKGFMTIRIHLNAHRSTPDVAWAFHELPARPMIQLKLPSSGLNDHDLMAWLKSRLNDLPANSVVKLISTGKPGSRRPRMPSARQLRTLTPPDMIVQPQRPSM